jgi:NAD(P)H-dependent flavin oxidoreductase YrpB (nitropropane dioxygenase family)
MVWRRFATKLKAVKTKKGITLNMCTPYFYTTSSKKDVDNGEVCFGQVAGLIDSAPGAAEVIEGIVKNLSSVLEELKRKLAAFPT